MRILCVDDDGLVLGVTADLLRELGHEVIEARGGHAAAACVRHAAIDLLVTDIVMPGGPDGLELTELARQSRPGLPVIYFSGLSHVVPQAVNRIVLRKPCSLGELQKAIENLIRHAAAPPESPRMFRAGNRVGHHAIRNDIHPITTARANW